MQYSGYPPSATHRSNMPSFSQTQWICSKRWSLEWAASSGTQPCRVLGCRLLWIYCPGHDGVSRIERADRLASTSNITSGLQLVRAEVLRGLRNFLSRDWPEHHSTDRLKEMSRERKRPTFHSSRSGTTCVQPDKHWYCFDGNLGKTAERVGGSRTTTSLFERYDAILNWNWNWTLSVSRAPHLFFSYTYSLKTWRSDSKLLTNVYIFDDLWNNDKLLLKEKLAYFHTILLNKFSTFPAGFITWEVTWQSCDPVE